MAYFSSHFYSGIIACNQFDKCLRNLDYHPASWDAIAVIEEFNQYDTSFSKNIDPCLIPHNKAFWGPSYFFTDTKDYKNAPESANVAARKDN